MRREYRTLHLKENISGFTLVELLVAFAVFAVLVLVMTPVFKQGLDFWEITQSQVELRQNLDSATDFMSRELRRAIPGSIVTGDPDYIVSYNVYDDVDENVYNNPRYSFTIPQPKNGNHYIIFQAGGSAKQVEITSPSVIDIKSAVVESPLYPDTSYQITITGEYEGRNAVKAGNKELTVKTRFSPRVKG